MKVKYVNSLLTATSGAFIGFSVTDYLRVYGLFGPISLQEIFQHMVVFGFGVALLGLNALITLIGAIDARMHERR